MLDDRTGLFYINNKIINFSELESKLFGALILNKYKISTYEYLCQELYQMEASYYYKQRVITLLKRVRTKLKGLYEIKSVHGKGYYLVLE